MIKINRVFNDKLLQTRASDAIAGSKQQIARTVGKLRVQIAEHPLASLACAAAAGVVLGWIVKRR